MRSCKVADLDLFFKLIREFLCIYSYTKLQIWNLVQFQKVVFIDADTLVVQNVDDLFNHPSIAAAPDVFPPDKFNAGVLWVNLCAHKFRTSTIY